MPRILVCSDSHGRADLLALAYDQQPKADVLVFLGDGLDDTGILRYSGKEHYLVKGNCDGPGWDYPDVQELALAGKKIFCTHGHRFHVKYSLDEVLRNVKAHGKEQGFDLVLYGHTHVPRLNYEDGVLLFNPGSLHNGEYGFVDITPAGIFCQNLRVRR